ncbi:MAG: thioredoxin domain-containing protein [Planctomycetes bacterium]|nr:thioredoxin domain-containing protein [Planctomycetota bacterium]
MRSKPLMASAAARIALCGAFVLGACAAELPLNHLDGQTSAYLREHATNPVDWYPWGDEAFAKAASENKPIFLSIGYASCHWCHVMERESFRDAEIADFLNRHFVAIKVDREERPDVDAVYIAYVSALNGSAGWPLTVWLTPELAPFAGTTYLPPRGDEENPGLLPILGRIESLWRSDRSRIVAAASQGLDLLRTPDVPATSAGPLTSAAIGGAVSALAQDFDAEHGGFGRGSKFPGCPTLTMLARASTRPDIEPVVRDRARAMLRGTLDAMVSGGINDHLGGGFHRYTVDRAWRVPHFEKMLSDQAQLTTVYTDVWRMTADDSYRRAALGILAYVRRDLTAADGCFYASEDADSARIGQDGETERVEGAFYLWTREQVGSALAALGADAAQATALAESLYGLTDETELDGAHVLRRVRTIADAAAGCGVEPAEAPALAERIAAALLAERSKRPRPLRDDKIVTAWNGTMISALARAAAAFGDPQPLADARRAASWLRSHALRADGGLARSWAGGSAGAPAVAADYAGLIAGLIDLFEASGESTWLVWAIQLQDELDARLGDGHGGYFDAPADPKLPVRPRSPFDGAEPAAIGIIALNLHRLGSILSDDRRRTAADAAIDGQAEIISRVPRATCSLLCALDQRLGPDLHVAIAGDAEPMQPLLVVAHAGYRPRQVTVPLPRADPFVSQRVPELAALQATTGAARALVCSGTTCLAPTTDPLVLARQLSEQSP